MLQRPLLLVLVLVACSGQDDVDVQRDAALADGAQIDSMQLDGGFVATCTGACATTSLAAAFQVTRAFNRAHFGVTAADNTLHVEAYFGGGSGCPTMSSPTPDYALILGRVPRPTSMATSSSPANLLDYEGDLLGGPLGAPATTVTLTPVAATDAFVAFDVNIAFGAGAVIGHFYATRCASLDTP